MNRDNQILQDLIIGGLVGATVGAMVSKKTDQGTILGAIAGAAILATYHANQEAKKTKVPVLIEKNGSIYEIQPDGKELFFKKIEKPSFNLPERFKLK